MLHLSHSLLLYPTVSQNALSLSPPPRCSVDLALLLMSTIGLFAQNPIYGKPTILSTANQDTLKGKMTNFSTFHLHPLLVWSAVQYSGKGTATIRLNTDGSVMNVFLRKSSIFSSGAKMAIQNPTGVLLQDLQGDELYRGYINGDTAQFAAFIIKKDKFLGYYRLGSTIWQIDQVGTFTNGLQGDMSTVYAKYKEAIVLPIDCASNFTSTTTDDGVLEREDVPRYLELAYDVDGTMYADLGSEAAVQSYIVDLALAEEKKYRVAYAGFKFSVVHINIWKDAATDPYSGTAVARWTQLKNWWQNLANGKGCIRRDAVALLTGPSGLSAHGFVNDAGFASICGSETDQSCIWFPYSVVGYSSVLHFDANNAAHELGHNFGLGHRCTCGVMLASTACTNGQAYPSCTGNNAGLLNNFDDKGISRIKSYFTGVRKTCRNDIIGPSDACMLDAPPVDLGFNLILTADQVIMTDRSVICPGGSFTASFYNTYDPNGSLTWALGPLLTFDGGNPPAGTKQAKIKLPSTINVCAPFDSWVETSFNYACGGPVTYRLPVRLGSSFNLDGIYTGTAEISKTISSANYVVPGSYDLQLENPNATYIWTQTSGSSTTTLPNTGNRISFGIVANQSVSFTVSTTSECCAFQRTFAFFANGGGFMPANGNTGSAKHQVYPNPATDMVTILFNTLGSPVS